MVTTTEQDTDNFDYESTAGIAREDIEKGSFSLGPRKDFFVDSDPRRNDSDPDQVVVGYNPSDPYDEELYCIKPLIDLLEEEVESYGGDDPEQELEELSKDDEYGLRKYLKLMLALRDAYRKWESEEMQNG